MDCILRPTTYRAILFGCLAHRGSNLAEPDCIRDIISQMQSFWKCWASNNCRLLPRKLIDRSMEDCQRENHADHVSCSKDILPWQIADHPQKLVHGVDSGCG